MGEMSCRGGRWGPRWRRGDASVVGIAGLAGVRIGLEVAEGGRPTPVSRVNFVTFAYYV
jgi:hypothetical protein